jgi:Fe2+ or Zn2+ uptake regulation protein
MLSVDRVVQKMRQEGYRITKPRQAVIRAIVEDGSYSSPAEVHRRARRYYPAVGLVTVYRTLDLLTEMGLARRIHSEERCQGYVAASNGHRHHLVCRRCGAAVEIEGCDLSPFLARVGRETGYRIQDHLLELVGICSKCQ